MSLKPRRSGIYKAKGAKIYSKALTKCDDSDNVPISSFTHPPEGDMDDKLRDNTDVI